MDSITKNHKNSPYVSKFLEILAQNGDFEPHIMMHFRAKKSKFWKFLHKIFSSPHKDATYQNSASKPLHSSNKVMRFFFHFKVLGPIFDQKSLFLANFESISKKMWHMRPIFVIFSNIFHKSNLLNKKIPSKKHFSEKYMGFWLIYLLIFI